MLNQELGSSSVRADSESVYEPPASRRQPAIGAMFFVSGLSGRRCEEALVSDARAASGSTKPNP